MSPHAHHGPAVPRWRALAVLAVLAASLATLGIKAARLQLILGDDLRGLAETQYLKSIQVGAPRGDITDRRGRALAVSVPAWSVSARPAVVEDKASAAAALAPVLGLDAGDLLLRLSGEARFLWLKRRAPAEVADAVRALGIPGVELRQEMRRTWPQKALAGQLLGLVDVDGKAAGGVEQAFDDALQGRSTSVPALADNRGDRIALADGLDFALLDGDTVALTIDLAIQREAEEAVAAAVAEHGAKAGWAIAMDARTGAVLAVANAPAFNPNAPEPATSKNRAFAEAFEPASIFKIATFAAALDAGKIAPDDRIFCENGRIQIGTHVIHDLHKAEWLSAVEVFQQSSNIGTLKIAQRLGEDAMKAALARYHFGERPGTGVDESKGSLPPPGRWGDVRLATVSFGHGVLVTALQMLSLAQAVGNGGVRKTPYVLERVTTAAGDVVRTAAADEGERLMTEKTAKTLTDIMKTVEKEGGTGTLAAIPGVEVAGKTGTAEKVDPVTRKYSDDLHIASFVGFAPADAPRIVAIVVLDEPQGAQHFGGMVAAPAWRRIVERALVEDGALAQGQLARIDVTPVVKPVAEGARIEDVATERAVEGGRGGALDLRGLGARAAVRAAELAGVNVELVGSGVVVAQEPAADKPVPPGTRLKLTLGEPAPPAEVVVAPSRAHRTRRASPPPTTPAVASRSQHAKAGKR